MKRTKSTQAGEEEGSRRTHGRGGGREGEGREGRWQGGEEEAGVFLCNFFPWFLSLFPL